MKKKNRFDDNESQSELDEEVQLPKKARVIRANVLGKIEKFQLVFFLNKTQY